MKKTTTAFVGGLVLLAGACKDSVTAPSRDRVVAGTAQSLQTLVTGILASDRSQAGLQSYYAFGDIMARDALRLDPNETRYVTEFITTPIDNSDFIGTAQWYTYYYTLRAIHALLPNSAVQKQSPGAVAATTGFLRTVEAQIYTRLIETHDQNGIVIQGADSSKIDPIVDKQTALKYISALLDSADTDLQAAKAAGQAAVPFTLPAGYTSVGGDYSQVANLILWNRGLKGKIEVFRALDPKAPNAASAAVALTALDSALAGAPATPDQAYLNQGPYLEFNPASPELAPNPLPDIKLVLTQNFVDSVKAGDKRAAHILPLAKTQVAAGYSSNYRWDITDPSNAANLSLPLPILRNGELYLLRAQAEVALGDLAAATADVNVIHTVEGGLAPYPTFTSVAQAQDAILYEYRYSFVFQGWQHIAADREYGGLSTAFLSQPDVPTSSTDPRTTALPIPKDELNGRQ